jgi:signal transduction histidine kinase
VTMAFATGYVALFLQSGQTATSGDIVEINQLKVQFQKSVDPELIINFKSLYYSSEQFKLLDPSQAMAQTILQNQPRDLFSSNKKCFKNLPKLLNQGPYEKVWLWEEFRCGIRSFLPRSFFRKAPFLHPSGQSYAFLAYKLAKSGHGRKSWVWSHLPFFHAIELSTLRRELGDLREIFSVLSRLDENALSQLAAGKGTILTKNYLLARITYPEAFSILEYRVYGRSRLDGFLHDGPFNLSNFTQGKPCFYRDGDLCWQYNIRHIFQLANTSSIVLFFGLIIIVAGVVRLLLTKIRNQRLEDEKRRLALRVLTHEFRTPITSMLLLVDRLGRRYEQFDEEEEDIYLRMSSEVHRLKRLTETSRHYLKANQSEKLLDLKIDKIQSLNGLLLGMMEPFIEEYQEKVSFNPLNQDRPVCLDTYWLGICFKNIMENAATHGEFPIIVTLYEKDQITHLEIKDHGDCQFSGLNEMCSEFVKGNKSSGTGLGMNIVKKVCQEMGIGLSLELSPTRITLSLPKKEKV